MLTLCANLFASNMIFPPVFLDPSPEFVGRVGARPKVSAIIMVLSRARNPPFGEMAGYGAPLRDIGSARRE
jgi:hypothetical protein